MARPRARSFGCFGDDSCAEASLLQTEARHDRKQTLLPVFGGSVQLRLAVAENGKNTLVQEIALAAFNSFLPQPVCGSWG